MPRPPLTKTLYNAPGATLATDTELLNFGEAIREVVWQYPILPGALLTYMQMTAGREWVVSSSTAAKASRTVDFFNNAVCRNVDGTESYGLEDILRRMAIDNLALGKFAWTFENKRFEYLDAVALSWNQNSRKWEYNGAGTGRVEEYNKILMTYAIPLGNRSYKIPLASIIPSAIMQWLIREHDMASADGRKIRDIFITLKGVRQSLTSALAKNVAAYNRGDFSKKGVSIVEIEIPDSMNASGIDVSKLIHRLGIAEIPQGYDRSAGEFLFVNEIAALTGMSLRHFWNSERATNRALEEVQEARQQQKGPTALVRTIGRSINNSGMYAFCDLGTATKFEFIEEVDQQTAETESKILLNYASAFAMFRDKFGDTISLPALLAWLQSKHQLPPDITIDENALKTMQNSDQSPTPLDGAMQPGNPVVAPMTGDEEKPKSTVEKSYPVVDYDHILMDSRGNIIEKRNRVHAVRLIENEFLNDPAFIEKARELIRDFSVSELAVQVQSSLHANFLENSDILKVTYPENRDEIEKIGTIFEDLTPEELVFITNIMSKWDSDDAANN